LPVQWRLALGGIVNYFATSLFTPVMFWYYGARVAGQMGMGWQVMGAAQTIALTWVQANIPTLGAFVAHKKFHELDRFFFRIVAISYLVLITLCGVGWFLVKAIYMFYPRFSERFMPLAPLAVFLLAALTYHLPQCQAVYLRVHRREPLLGISVISSFLIGVTVWFFGKRFGLMGAGCAYLACVALVIVPSVMFIWGRCRENWHV
jgi:O-antigen/teichoic acid export membrane protein